MNARQRQTRPAGWSRSAIAASASSPGRRTIAAPARVNWIPAALGWIGDAFIDAMAEQGLERGAEIVAQGDFTLASGEDAARLLLEVSPRPTAILAANDAMAAGALRAIRAAGLDVPGDISVMGLGDIPLAAALAPPLATMALPWRELARLAATRIVNPATPAPPALPARLVPRASVGPAVE